MPLPTTTPVPLLGQQGPSQTAFLIKFPEDLLAALHAGSGVTITVSEDGSLRLNLPAQPPLDLELRATTTPSEIHRLSPSTSRPSHPSLSLTALASTRLSIPFSTAATARAADKLRAGNELHERERKERAVKVDGVKRSAPGRGSGVAASGRPAAGGVRSAPMTLTSSAPGAVGAGFGFGDPAPAHGSSALAGSHGASASASVGGSMGGGAPLKTRVMQYLAMGATTAAELVRRMGGDEQNVMRVVNVVGRASPTNPPTYTLLPTQYSKLKLGAGQWKYTYAEQAEVVRLAREAFDELGLPEDAEERVELARKEREAVAGYGSGRSSDEQEAAGGKPAPAGGISRVRERGKARTESPAPVSRVKFSSTTTTIDTPSPLSHPHPPLPPTHSHAATPPPGSAPGSSSTPKASAGPQSKIAKERAKFVAERKRLTGSASGSLSNVKGPDGLASPRLSALPFGSPSPEKKSSLSVSATDDPADPTKPRSRKVVQVVLPSRTPASSSKKRRVAHDYSSDEGSSASVSSRSSSEGDESGGRGRGRGKRRVSVASAPAGVHEKAKDSASLKQSAKPRTSAPPPDGIRDKSRDRLADKPIEKAKAKEKDQEKEKDKDKEKPRPLAEIIRQREAKQKRKRPSVDYSSSEEEGSEEEGEIRGRSASASSRVVEKKQGQGEGDRRRNGHDVAMAAHLPRESERGSGRDRERDRDRGRDRNGEREREVDRERDRTRDGGRDRDRDREGEREPKRPKTEGAEGKHVPGGLSRSTSSVPAPAGSRNGTTASSSSSSTRPPSASVPNGTSKPPTSHPPADADALRDRYEELFPAYQQLTDKLSRVHTAAERGEAEGVDKAGLEKMVGKWRKWHKELAEIRRWFGEA